MSLFLRSSRVISKFGFPPQASSQLGTETLLRAISRQYGKEMGWLTLGGDLSWLQDVSGQKQAMLSHMADARFAAGLEVIADMQSIFEVSHSDKCLNSCSCAQSSRKRLFRLYVSIFPWKDAYSCVAFTDISCILHSFIYKQHFMGITTAS